MIKIGVVGCGYWGPNIIRNFNSLDGCIVKTICDLDENRLKHLRSLYNHLTVTKDFSEIVNDDDIDAIAIATPVRFHFDMAYQSLKAGKHTFVEKPLAMSSQQCIKLMEEQSRQGLTLMVGHTFIYSSPVRKIKKIIDSGELGNLYYISCRRLNLGLFQKDINVAWDLAPHDLSIILYVMEQLPISVNCQGKAHVNADIEDVTNLTLNFDGGGWAVIHSSWLDPNKIRELTFVGDKKMLLYNDIEQFEKIKIYDKRVDLPPHYDTFAEFQYAYHYGDMYSPFVEMIEPVKTQCIHFINCIKEGKEPLSGAKEGLEVVRILEAASESLASCGREIEIKRN